MTWVHLKIILIAYLSLITILYMHPEHSYLCMLYSCACYICYLLPKACEYVGPFVLQLKTLHDAEVCLNPGAVLLPAASICQQGDA